MFLTSNPLTRVNPFFLSRVHFQFEYKPLPEDLRHAIWQMKIDAALQSMERSEFGLLTEQDVGILGSAAMHKWAPLGLSGRQISNTVKAARALAKGKNEPLGEIHFQLVMDQATWTSTWTDEMRF